MGEMFMRAKSFNQDLNAWNVSIDTNIGGMFKNNDRNFNLPNWYIQDDEDDEDDDDNQSYDSEDENDYGDNVPIPTQEEEERLIKQQQLLREKQVEIQKEVVKNINQDEVTTTKPTCSICYLELNNEDGPGPSTDEPKKCEIDCNDVVNVCENNHLFHRRCILESCNASPVNMYEQMGMQIASQQYIAEQNIATTCPLCRRPLLTVCSNFKNTEIVKQVAYDKIGDDGMEIKTRGGRRHTRKSSNKKKSSKNKLTKKKLNKNKSSKNKLTKKNKLSVNLKSKNKKLKTKKQLVVKDNSIKRDLHKNKRKVKTKKNKK